MSFDLTKIKLTPVIEKKIRERLTGDLGLIADEFDVSTALKMHKLFRGTWLRINILEEIEREIRDERIRADFDEGLTGDALARKYDLTDRQIWNILGKESKDPEILPLFPPDDSSN